MGERISLRGFLVNSVTLREPGVFRKGNIRFRTNSEERAAQHRITWLFFVRAIVGGPGFPRRTRCRWLIICGKTARAARRGRRRPFAKGQPAMLPAPPCGPTSRAIRGSELLLPKSGETAT